MGIPSGNRVEAELGDKRTVHIEGQYADDDDDEPLWATGSDCMRPTGLKLSYEQIRSAIYSEWLSLGRPIRRIWYGGYHFKDEEGEWIWREGAVDIIHR